jgi:hypothetical protein
MRLAVLFLLAAALAACSPSMPDTPLVHAIAAMRAGDAAAFAQAKAESDAAMARVSWHPGAERCDLTVQDIEAYGEAALIGHLDHPELFKRSENARFVYVAKVAGKYDAAMAEVTPTPMFQEFMDIDPTRHRVSCPQAAFGAGAGYVHGPPGEEQRRAVFKDWRDALLARYGDGPYETAMRNAAAELGNTGFYAEWPADLKVDYDPAINNWHQVWAENGGPKDW